MDKSGNMSHSSFKTVSLFSIMSSLISVSGVGTTCALAAQYSSVMMEQPDMIGTTKDLTNVIGGSILITHDKDSRIDGMGIVLRFGKP